MPIFLALQINKSKGKKIMMNKQICFKIFLKDTHRQCITWNPPPKSSSLCQFLRETKQKNRPQCFLYDQAERHGIWPRLWLFFPPFLFSPKKGEDEKENELAIIVIKGHAFLLDLLVYFRIWNITNNCLLNKVQRLSKLKHM